jgi:MarR family 2-MHQ and catechol resistance regulon transcriptional repressor
MGTKYTGMKEEVRAVDAFIKLVRAAGSVSGRVEAHLSGPGLTASQFGVLEALYHGGPLFQKQLGEKISKSGGNVTMVVDNLERRGLVKRARDRRDRRQVVVQVTVKGSGLLRTFLPRHVEHIVAEMAVLTGTEQEELGRLCRKFFRAEKRIGTA